MKQEQLVAYLVKGFTKLLHDVDLIDDNHYLELVKHPSQEDLELPYHGQEVEF